MAKWKRLFDCLVPFATRKHSSGTSKSAGKPKWDDAEPLPAYLSDPCQDMQKSVQQAQIDCFFEHARKDKLAQTVLNNSSFTDALISPEIKIKNQNVFSIQLEREGNITNQKSSGRCWIFAATNVMRLGLMEKFNLVEFELSQNYLFFWDKLEKSNFFLENMIELALDEKDDSRLLHTLLEAPVNDGGQWDMILNLVAKYGVVPQSVFPESYHSSNSSQMNWLITRQLRQGAATLRKLVKDGHTKEQVRQQKAGMLNEIFRILSACLGSPPSQFEWSFRDGHGKYREFKNLTPVQFYKDFIEKSLMTQGLASGIHSLVSLVNDPRHPFDHKMQVLYLGNVVEGRKVEYINVDIQLMKQLAIKTLESKKPVWFGCDVGKFFDRKNGVLDLEAIDYTAAFGTHLSTSMSKADRLLFGESQMTHAMVLTGVHLDDQGQPVRWRIENSWGDQSGKNGFLVMSDAWFSEFVYQIVIDERLLKLTPPSSLDIIYLPPWDPMQVNILLVIYILGALWPNCLQVASNKLFCF